MQQENEKGELIQNKENEENQNDSKKNSKRKYFEITEDEKSQIHCYKKTGLEQVQKILAEEYGNDSENNKQAQNYSKTMRYFLKEVLDGFRENVHITREGRGEKKKGQEKINVQYNEIDQALLEKTQKKKKELKQVINKYNDKKQSIEKQSQVDLNELLNSNFNALQQYDVSDYQLLINNSKKNSTVAGDDGNEQDNQDDDQKQKEDSRDVPAQFNMVAFMKDYLKQLQNKYIDTQKNIQDLDLIIESQNQKILSEVKEVINETENLQMCQQFGLL